MKSSSKVYLTIILAGVALLMIGVLLLGIAFVRDGAQLSLFADHIPAFSAARQPASADEALPDISALTLRLGAVNVSILPGSETRLVTDGFDQDELSVQFSEATGRLVIEQADYDRVFSQATRQGTLDRITRSLTLYLRADVLEDFSLELGCGRLTLDALSADSAALRGGAVEFEGKQLTFGAAEMTLGAGDVSLRGCDFCDFTLHSGAASMVYTGVLGGECEIECGVGDLTLSLTDGAENYAFSVQGLGSITLNGRENAGLTVIEQGGSDAPAQVKIRTGVGSVEVWTDTV